jgi:hypothetical protein
MASMADIDPLSAEVEVGGWRILVGAQPPGLLPQYTDHAELHEWFEPAGIRDGHAFLFLAVARPSESWPSLVVTQWYSPSGPGFSPGALIVPETGVVLIGAGTRLLCFRGGGGRWTRGWEDETDVGFWGWRRVDDVVVMTAELEIAAWNLDGIKLWSTFVEPPWSYEVRDGVVHLDVMDTLSSFPLRSGPTTTDETAT